MWNAYKDGSPKANYVLFVILINFNKEIKGHCLKERNKFKTNQFKVRGRTSTYSLKVHKALL